MINIMSFGYKHGVPEGYEIVDCRSIKNPFGLKKFEGLTWMDPELQDYVIGDPMTGEKLWSANDLVGDSVNFNLAFGCFGGIHRSVILAELCASNLRAKAREVRITHRDLEEV